MALHCDFIFTTVDTKFGDTHAKFGLRPTWGMSQTLSQAIGVRLAKEMSYSARIILGDEAVKIGLANRAEENKGDLDALINKISSEISSNSQGSIKAFKDLYNLSQTGLGIDEALKACLLYTSPSPRDGLLSRMPSSA